MILNSSSGVILDYDINFSSGEIWDSKRHKDFLNFYSESVKESSFEIINLIGDKIKYTKPSIIGYQLVDDGKNKRLESYNLTPTLFKFSKIEEVILFFNQKKYNFYFVKSYKDSYSYQLYVYIQDNLPNLRQKKLQQLGI